jgi:hypothetical protein
MFCVTIPFPRSPASHTRPARTRNKHAPTLTHPHTLSFMHPVQAHCVSLWGHEFRKDYKELNVRVGAQRGRQLVGQGRLGGR